MLDAGLSTPTLPALLSSVHLAASWQRIVGRGRGGAGEESSLKGFQRRIASIKELRVDVLHDVSLIQYEMKKKVSIYHWHKTIIMLNGLIIFGAPERPFAAPPRGLCAAGVYMGIITPFARSLSRKSLFGSMAHNITYSSRASGTFFNGTLRKRKPGSVVGRGSRPPRMLNWRA